MGLTFARGDRAPSRVLRAAPTSIRRAYDRSCLVVRLVIAMLIALATPSLRADTVQPDPVVVLRHGGIVLSVPGRRPTNAPPMNPNSPGDVLTQRYNNLRTGTTFQDKLNQDAVEHHFGFIGILGSKNLDATEQVDHNAIDGVVTAQPLFVKDVVVQGQLR